MIFFKIFLAFLMHMRATSSFRYFSVFIKYHIARQLIA